MFEKELKSMSGYKKQLPKLLPAVLISCFMFSFQATAIELLSQPSLPSHLASKSIITDIKPIKNGVIGVGERGHVVLWENEKQWQQLQTPTSVSLTAVDSMTPERYIAVGHDAAIITSAGENKPWVKVFDGYQLSKMQAEALAIQMKKIQFQIENSTDEDEIEELEYQFEELEFSLEDSEKELETGPNKPLLDIVHTNNGTVFAVGAYGTLLRSDDYGNNWTLLDNLLDNPDKFHLNSIIYTNSKLYIVGESGTGFMSNDDGKTWNTMSMPYSGSLFGILGVNDTPNLVAFGLQGNFMVSTDEGNTWQHLTSGSSASFLAGSIDKSGTTTLVGHGGMMLSFNVNEPTKYNIKKHPSGAALSSISIHSTKIILGGQYGMTTWHE